MQSSVNQVFGPKPPAAPAPGLMTDAGSAAPAAAALNPDGTPAAAPDAPLLPRAGASFKVLAECPLTVMLLFQLYPRYIQEFVPQLIKLMIAALSLNLMAIAQQPHVGALRARFAELVLCQVRARASGRRRFALVLGLAATAAVLRSHAGLHHADCAR